MGGPSVIALVDGLRNNKTLKSLDLSQNCRLIQSGRDAIERLLGYNVLREHNMFMTANSIDAATLTNGLSANHSIEKLNVEGTFAGMRAPKPSVLFVKACAETRHSDTLLVLIVYV
jgi:hypothetical protein